MAPGKNTRRTPEQLANLRPPYSSTNQPAPERRSGGRRPWTTAVRKHFENEKELLALLKSAVAAAKKGNSTALDRIIEALDGPRVQRHAVAAAAVDLSSADDRTLDALEGILERIASGSVSDD